MSIIAFVCDLAFVLLACSAKCTLSASSSTSIFSMLTIEVVSDSKVTHKVELITQDYQIVKDSILNKDVNSTSKATFIIYFIKPGSFDIIFRCDSSSNVTNKVLASEIPFTLEYAVAAPKTIGDKFGLKIKMNENSIQGTIFYEVLLIGNKDQNIMSSQLEGILSKNSKESVCIFDNLRIKNQGVYFIEIRIKVQDSMNNNYLQSINSSSITISSTITNLSLECTSSIEQYVTTSCLLNVLGNNMQPFLDGFSIQLYANDSSILGGWTPKSNIFESSFNMSFYLKMFGSYQITAKVTQLSGTSLMINKTIYVKPAYFFINKINVNFT